MEARLVLESAGIANEAVHHAGRWHLIVDAIDQEAALSELDAYRRDNPAPSIRLGVKTRLFGGAGTGVFVYAAILVLVMAAASSPESRETWHSIGQMNAGQVTDGQWWRTITALMLHVDVAHLMSNLVYGAVFGFLAGRILGGGIGWLTIVVSGSLGNALNAAFRGAEHTSIGASTAVFAALGMLVAHALRPRRDLGQTVMQRWTPLIGGVVMLGLTGVGGERTDVGAHVAGFFAGLALGAIAARLPGRWLASGPIQVVAGFLAVAITVVAWLVAIAAARASA